MGRHQFTKHEQRFVYFAQCGEEPGGPVKIGVSSNPWSRLHEMQNFCPYLIRLCRVIPGSLADEKRIHRQFAHLRIRGEWFRADQELCAFINALEEERRRTA